MKNVDSASQWYRSQIKINQRSTFVAMFRLAAVTSQVIVYFRDKDNNNTRYFSSFARPRRATRPTLAMLMQMLTREKS